MAVFSLQEVKSLQVKDVSNNNYANWPEIGFSPLRGYLAGGSGSSSSLNSGNTCTIQRIDYSADVSAIFPSSLSIRRSRFGSWATPSYAWFQGDQTNGHSSQDRLDYSTEIISQPGQNSPSNAGYGLFGTAQTPSIGYMAGGRSTAYKSGVVKFTFSTETFTFNPVGSLNVENAGNSGVYNSSYGYFGGGYYPPQPGTLGVICAINRIQFSNETVSNITSASTKRFHPAQYTFQRATTQDSTYGYWAGGQKDPPPAASYVDEIDRFQFSTEVFNPATPHSLGLGWVTMPADASPSFRGKTAVAGASSGSHAYWVGGYDFGGEVSNIHKMDFSTGTFTNPGSLGYGIQGAVLTDSQTVTVRNRAREKGYNTYGYFGGGLTIQPTTSHSRVDRIDFSNDTTSVPPSSNLPAARRSLAGTSDNFYGYFVGGHLPPFTAIIDRIDFSNETTSAPGNNLSQARRFLAATSSSSYGYLGGGDKSTPPFTLSSVERIDFSNETLSSLSNNLSEARNDLSAVSSNSYGYFAGGNAPPYSSTVDRIDFSSDIISSPGNDVPQTRDRRSSFSNSSYGWFGGGTLSGTPSATVDRLDFSNETWSAPGNDTPQARRLQAATAGNHHSYFGGGYITSITMRMEFSDETWSAPGNNLSIARSSLAGVTN